MASRSVDVVFDAFALATASARSGIGTYERRLLSGLASRSDVHVRALAPRAGTVPAGVERRIVGRRAPGRFAQLEHDIRLRWDLRHVDGDLFHSPAPYAPRSPVRRPWVQTLHDVIPLVFDDPELAGSRRRFAASAGSYRSANAVIAVSRHSADEGMRVLGLDPRRVHVVPEAVDPAFTPGPAPDGAADEPYVLMVSAFDPRKGFAEAFAVVGALAERGFPHRLKVVGSIAEDVRPAVERLRVAAPHPDRVELLGYMDDLVGLYRGAAVTLVPSRYEGFGLPALEAMACGSPVVAFANTSLPEVVGDGGVLVPDGDVVAFADAVASLLREPARRAELSDAALARAAMFTEEAFIEGHVAVYRSVTR